MRKTLKTVESALVLSIAVSVISSICAISLFYLFILAMHDSSTAKVATSKLDNVIDNYKHNFISKVAVIVSSTEVVDYLRSSQLTRKELKAGVFRVMARMPKDKEISGWRFIDKNGQTLVNIGTNTTQLVELGLCYLSSGLSSKYGDCVSTLIVYFNKNKLISKLNKYDSNIEECLACKEKQVFSDYQNSFFNINSNVVINVNYEMGSNYPIWPLLIISLSGLIWVGYWSKKRIRLILRRDIINPLTSVCRKDQYNSVTGYAESTVEEIVDIRMKYKLLQTQTVTAEQEKRKLANELHDALGSFIIKLRWEVAEILKRNNNNKEDLPLIQTALSSVDYLLSATDDIIEALRPEVVDTLGLKEAIRSLVAEWEELQQFTVEQSFDFDDTNLPDVVTHSAYRIIQESLANIIKHSKATAVIVSVKVICFNQDNGLQLLIQDNGTGFNNKIVKGHGLSSMRERSLSLGGHFEITSKLNQGTTIRVVLPLNFSISL